MKKIGMMLLTVLIVVSFWSCTEISTPLDTSVEDAGAPVDSRWYIVSSASGTVNYISLDDYSIHANAFSADALNTQIITLKIKSAYAYLGSGYFSGAGSHDVKKIALSDGKVKASYDVGAGRNITAEGLAIEDGLVYAVDYTSLGNGILHTINTKSMTLNSSVAIGGMPQAVIAKLGNVYCGVINSYSYGTNWIAILKAGSTSPTNVLISDKDPLSLCISDDGTTLYALCAGTGAGDGSICVITNIPDHPAIKTSISLGFSSYGTIRMISGMVYFTSGNGLWKMNPSTCSYSKVALAGRGLTDIQSDDYYLYITGGYDDSYVVNNRAYVLRQFDNTVICSNSVNYGMSAIYH